MKTEKTVEMKNWCSEYYNIPAEEVKAFFSGSCYSTILVTTKESAIKVNEMVKHGVVNGGWLDGMQLGEITENNDGTFSVMC